MDLNGLNNFTNAINRNNIKPMVTKLENYGQRVLVVDDDPESVKIVSKALEWEGYVVESASSGREAISKINHYQPHLVLLDINMPGLNGLDTLKYLRANNEYVATIFVSGQSNTEDVIRGLDASADDYICKPFDTGELLARVRSQLRIKKLHDELKAANAKLKELVDIDDLTGLFNMRSLYGKLDYEIERASRYERGLCVIMMDMDHFKTVNDNHDHLFGSFVLSEVGSIIKKNIRKIDFAARYGGDEFLIVLTETDAVGAKSFTERLRSKIENNVFKSNDYQIQLTTSIGFAVLGKSIKGMDAKTFVRHADKALYDAKENGRNRVHYYDFDKDESVLLNPGKPKVLRKIS